MTAPKGSSTPPPEALSKEERRLLLEAWRQLHWFEFQRGNAEAAAAYGRETISYNLNTAYMLKSAEVFRAINAVLKVGSDAIEVQL
jgi:hypothetical protein